jgi:hypothetical protein
MLAYPLARLVEMPRDPDPEFDVRAWALLCGAPCGCREEVGIVLLEDAAAGRWMIALSDDHYQPSATGVWTRRARIRRAKLQPWATGSAITPTTVVWNGTRQRIQATDMREWEAGQPQPSGHLIGPLGEGRTPLEVSIACRFGHVNRVSVASIESEVRRLADLSSVL